MKVYNHVRKPEFFIIGAPRCGTTALARYLGEHPDIHLSYPKEPNYFNTDFSKKQRKFESKTLYLNQCFYKARENKIAGEATVWYLYSKDAVPNILEFNPDARFIVMLRNPVDLAYAIHSKQISRKVNENIEDFETAWRLQEKRLQGEHLPSTHRDPKLVQYKEIAMLGKQMQRLYSYVDKERVKVILFDDFKADNKSVYEDTLKFLGISTDNRQNFPVINSNSRFRFRWMAKMFSIIGISTPYVLLLKRKLGIPEGYSLFRALNKAQVTYEKRKPLNKAFRNELVQTFKDDIVLLQSLIDRDLTHWLK